MKKILAILAFVVITVSSSITAFAGDIPESLMHSDEAQIFFGEAVDYHPNKENPSIGVSPVKVIKGNVIEGSYRIYNKPFPMGNFIVIHGKIYLFTYYDEVNSTDIFEVTTYDTRTLKLKHVEGNMWKRFEKYLNEGKYGEVKIEGIRPYTVDIAFTFVVGIVCVSVILAIMICKKRKKKAVR